MKRLLPGWSRISGRVLLSKRLNPSPNPLRKKLMLLRRFDALAS
jgi:hypothetical protein